MTAPAPAPTPAPDLAPAGSILLSGRDLVQTYQARGGALFRRAPRVRALDGVSVEIPRGAGVAIVGESGSGKSTLLRLLLGLERPESGTVAFDGREVVAKRSDRLLWLRSRTGIVFQDPYASLNPRRTIGQTVAEPLEAIGAPGDHAALVRAMLARLDLPEDTAERYPAEFSGGQRQRIALARALVHGPDLLVGDEPVSALDVLVRRRILELLAELRAELGLTLLTVTHDLGIVPDLAEHIIVMHRGVVIESGPVEQILGAPREPYTRALVAAIPRLPGRTP
ncbi:MULTISPECIES: ATP-binding cassette domain-containing protein [unclassified Leucobacter]|uniref:ATP-binding cassette domain-containing protein n=1 Tax=unclassified Leucobacter TaxID=2621730 RepID=UPI00165E3625|nr:MULTISPECIES: ATP-binding cassette domain-containing protein [unclassified Leucobacter]MBC9926543.1 ABC transporter ATP-binding protein [Leucobacter sp. cx-169]